MPFRLEIPDALVIPGLLSGRSVLFLQVRREKCTISLDRKSENEFQRQGGSWPNWRGTGEGAWGARSWSPVGRGGKLGASCGERLACLGVRNRQ